MGGSLTLSYTLGNMKCDSQTSLLAHIFISPCLSREPKAKVAIMCILYCKYVIVMWSISTRIKSTSTKLLIIFYFKFEFVLSFFLFYFFIFYLLELLSCFLKASNTITKFCFCLVLKCA